MAMAGMICHVLQLCSTYYWLFTVSFPRCFICFALLLAARRWKVCHKTSPSTVWAKSVHKLCANARPYNKLGAGMETGTTTRAGRSMGKKLRASKQQRGTMLQEQNVQHALNLLKHNAPDLSACWKESSALKAKRCRNPNESGDSITKTYKRATIQISDTAGEIRRNSHTSRMALAGPDYVCRNKHN